MEAKATNEILLQSILTGTVDMMKTPFGSSIRYCSIMKHNPIESSKDMDLPSPLDKRLLQPLNMKKITHNG